MELGATICTPKAVKCHSCPIRDSCRLHYMVHHPPSSTSSRILVSENKASPVTAATTTAVVTKNGSTKSSTKKKMQRNEGDSDNDKKHEHRCSICDTSNGNGDRSDVKWPTSVMEYPRVAKKKESPTETVAVCIVTRSTSSPTPTTTTATTVAMTEAKQSKKNGTLHGWFKSNNNNRTDGTTDSNSSKRTEVDLCMMEQKRSWWLSLDTESIEYLIVKRPSHGLLAGNTFPPFVPFIHLSH
jgi:adenine-specific DNA glycosylase